MKLELTKREAEILLHMTGLDRGKEIYRNHYCANGEEDPDIETLNSMVEKNLIGKVKRVDWIPYQMYKTTTFGESVAWSIKENESKS